jgi:molybdate transport repressor ModE-like protein
LPALGLVRYDQRATLLFAEDQAMSPTSELTPRVKFWLERRDQYAFGHGLCQILEAVQATGSIKQAAAQLGKSYRHIWARVKAAEAALEQVLVETHVGGRGPQRSCLSEAGKQLVEDYQTIRQRIIALVEEEFARRFAAPSLRKK